MAKRTINVNRDVFERARRVQAKLMDLTRGPRGGNPTFISLEETVAIALLDLEKKADEKVKMRKVREAKK